MSRKPKGNDVVIQQLKEIGIAQNQYLKTFTSTGKSPVKIFDH